MKSKYRKEFYDIECTVCGSDIKAKSPSQKYCSEKCKKSNRSNKKASRDKVCAYRHCNEKFHDDTPFNQKKYCDSGNECNRRESRYRTLEKKADPPYPLPEELFLKDQTRECVQCGNSFTPINSHQKYCTHSCRKDEKFEELYKDVPDQLSRTVQCLECGKEFRSKIPDGKSGGKGSHLWEDHGLTMEDYRKKHGGAPIYSEAAKWKMRDADREFPDDFSDRCRKAQLKRYGKDTIWNKGLTKEDHSGIAAIAKKAKKRLAIPENNPAFGTTKTDEELEAMSMRTKKCWKDPEYVQKQIKSRQYRFRSGEFVSVPHAVLIQAMTTVQIYHEYNFDYEYLLKFSDGNSKNVDLASETAKVAIEIDGCYWHGCPECYDISDYTSKYDAKAVRRKKATDKRLSKAMKTKGFKVFRFWTHELEDDLTSCLTEIADYLGHSEIIEDMSYGLVKNSLDKWIQDLVDYQRKELEEEEV